MSSVIISSLFKSDSCDTLGRPSRVIRTIDGVGYSQWQTYDDYSRPYITTYPGSSVDVCGYQVKNIYDALGFLREVRDARATGSLYGNDVPAGYLYWKADGYALTGAINASTLGNGATLDRVISDITGRTFAITSGKGQAAEIQNVIYNFDAIGNVLRRQNSSTSSDEVFHYDGLNRLIDSNVNGASLINVTYDSLGSIQTKTNAGTYAYGENGYGPHALTTISGGPLGTRSFHYDANGNLTTETVGGISQRTQTWTSYNQMKTTTKNGRSTEFWFGANHERVLQQDNNGTKTVYIGLAMEIVSKGGLIERKTYIFTPAGRVAIRTERNDATPVETRFLHQDALGSVTAVTDEFGNVEQRFAFDAWGLRSQPVTTRTRTGGAITRGYTDHEQLDDYGLIHMNGRVYDPTLSRFLSTDAFVQNPLDNQTFNRYSYVSNNPTGRTDPTGWVICHKDNPDGTTNYYFSSEEERTDFLKSLGDRGLVLVNANIAPFGKENPGKNNTIATGAGSSNESRTPDGIVVGEKNRNVPVEKDTAKDIDPKSPLSREAMKYVDAPGQFRVVKGSGKYTPDQVERLKALFEKARNLCGPDGKLTEGAMLLRLLERTGLADHIYIDPSFMETQVGGGGTRPIDGSTGNSSTQDARNGTPTWARVQVDVASPNSAAVLLHEIAHAAQYVLGTTLYATKPEEWEPTRISNQAYRALGINRISDTYGCSEGKYNPLKRVDDWNRYIPDIKKADHHL